VKNGRVSDAGEFIDLSLQREGSWRRAEELQSRLEKEPGGQGLRFYGASVGAVRGTVRDARRRHPGLSHDEITALSSELWTVPVFERRLAAVVLLQSNVNLLTNSDLTRMEGFIREARLRDLVDPLAVDVVGPLMDGLDVLARVRADSVLDRWAGEPDAWLRRAALLSPLLALRAGAGDWGRFIRHANAVLEELPGMFDEADGGAVREAVSRVRAEMAKRRPELQFTTVKG
jgi:DNA alkylation repair enzyme